jgi:hypothetical protein
VKARRKAITSDMVQNLMGQACSGSKRARNAARKALEKIAKTQTPVAGKPRAGVESIAQAFCTRERNRTQPITANASQSFQQGQFAGNYLRGLSEMADRPCPTPADRERAASVFNESRQWIAGELGKIPYLDTRDAMADFLRGALEGLTYAPPSKGDNDTDEIRGIFFEHFGEIVSDTEGGCRRDKAIPTGGEGETVDARPASRL